MLQLPKVKWLFDVAPRQPKKSPCHPAFRASLETGGAQIGNSINRTGLSLSASQASRAIAPSAPSSDRKAERTIASLDRSGQDSGSVQKVVSLQSAPTTKPNMELASLAATTPTPANSSATVGLAILKDECKARLRLWNQPKKKQSPGLRKPVQLLMTNTKSGSGKTWIEQVAALSPRPWRVKCLRFHQIVEMRFSATWQSGGVVEID